MDINIFSSLSFHVKDLSRNIKQFKLVLSNFFIEILFMHCMSILITIVSKILVAYIIYFFV